MKEAERNTVAVKLRLSPEAAEDVKALAEDMKIPVSELMSRVIERLGGDGTADLLNEIHEEIKDERYLAKTGYNRR